MDEYISREAIIKELKKEIKACDMKFVEDIWINKGLKIALKDIKSQPAADVQPAKCGEWKINSDGYYPYCSVCGTAADQLTKRLTKYCPECGARMGGDTE